GRSYCGSISRGRAPGRAACPRSSRRRARYTEKTLNFKSVRDSLPVKSVLNVAIWRVLLPGKEGRLRNVQPSAGFALVLPGGSVGGRRPYVYAGSTATRSRGAITLQPASRRRQTVLRFLPLPPPENRRAPVRPDTR